MRFRLLSELYSLLLTLQGAIEKVEGSGFRLLSELYSLLFRNYEQLAKKVVKWNVSVSSRSYILSYPLVIIAKHTTAVNTVSVSSRSYILSYG